MLNQQMPSALGIKWTEDRLTLLQEMIGVSDHPDYNANWFLHMVESGELTEICSFANGIRVFLVPGTRGTGATLRSC